MQIQEIGITPEQIERLEADTAKDPLPCLPCPSPVCGNPSPTLEVKKWPNGDKNYFVECRNCNTRGARVAEDWNAIRHWNMLKRYEVETSASANQGSINANDNKMLAFKPSGPHATTHVTQGADPDTFAVFKKHSAGAEGLLIKGLVTLKTPKELYNEFSALTNDRERWQWVKANQGGDFMLVVLKMGHF